MKQQASGDTPHIKQSAASYAAKDWAAVIEATHKCTGPLSAAMQTRYDRAWRKLEFRGQRLHGINYPFQRLAVSPQGLWAAAGDRDGHIWVWELTWPFPSSFYAKGHPDTSWSLDFDGEIIELGFLDEMTLLVVTAKNGSIFWFDLATGATTRSQQLLRDENQLSKAILSYDLKTLYCLRPDEIWSVETSTGQVERRENPLSQRWGSFHFAMTSDNETAIGMDWRAAVAIWNFDTGQVLGTIAEGELVHSMAVDPKGNYLAIARRQVLVELYSLPSGARLPEISSAKEVRWSHDVVFSPNSRFAISAEVHGWNVALWDVPTGTMRAKLLSGRCSRVALSQNGRVLVVGGETPGIHDKEKMTVYAWEMPEGVLSDRGVLES